MRYTKLILVSCLALVFFASGCEYDFPLAAKQGIPIDNSVLGTWEQGKTQIKISRYSPTEYLINYSDKDEIIFRGYPIKIADKTLIQLALMDKDKAVKYFVVSYSVAGGDLMIKALASKIKAKNSVEFRNFFLANRNKANLFGEFGRFSKAAPNSLTNENRMAINQGELDAQLWNASKRGNAVAVRNLLAKGANPNMTTEKTGYTPLMTASYNGRLAVVQILLTKRVNVNHKGIDGWTALMMAAHEGHLPVVQALLTKGADPNIKNNKEATALIIATYQGNLPIVQSLIAKRADVNTKDYVGDTPLIMAAHKGNLDIVRTLLAKGANINLKGGKEEMTALMEASQHGFTSIARLLLATGADIFAEDVHGHTALDIAIENNHSGIAAILRQARNRTSSRNSCTEHTFRLNDWIRTGIAIKRGDRITFDASGYVSFGAFAGGGGPEGINGFRGYNLVRGDIQHGALVAVIDRNEGWYEIGRGRTITADTAGTLQLAVNDRDSSNNSGSFTVKVSVCKTR